MKNTIPACRPHAIAVACAMLLPAPLLATEGGGSTYPHGAENFVSGAMPPPGFYTLAYGTRYRATALRDNDGRDIAAAMGGFRAEINAVVPRFIWVTPKQLLGGQLAFHAMLPLLDADVRIGPTRQKDSGIGDLNLAIALGYHVSPAFHYVLALEVNAPTGSYDRERIANLGRNHWNIEPVLALTYTQAKGINADLKIMADYNFRNQDTNYRSGQELHADYALGWGFGNGWVVGVGGYLYHQLTDDRVGGVTLPGHKGRAATLGPSIKYQGKDGWFLTAKFERQYGVRNRPDGSAFWIKTILPF
ncbi:SphA family protein [Massilia niastensis]|uniref:SphA family protein n=1 Tax=Massilia niastensis TaxID=544911 RepID=UPI0003679706|nr:transporter [Massilia niastensis]